MKRQDRIESARKCQRDGKGFGLKSARLHNYAEALFPADPMQILMTSSMLCLYNSSTTSTTAFTLYYYYYPWLELGEYGDTLGRIRRDGILS